MESTAAVGVYEIFVVLGKWYSVGPHADGNNLQISDLIVHYRVLSDEGGCVCYSR